MTTPLMTYQELRRYPLPVKEEQWDKIGQTHVEDIIEFASQNIMDYVDLGIASAYYTERVQGNNLGSLMLDQYPIISVQTISHRDNQENNTALTVSDFIIDSGAGIIKFNDRFRNVFYSRYDYIVNYRAGWITTPGPIKHAVALQAVQMLQPMFRGGQNFTEIKLIDGLNEEIVDLLEKYKRKRIG